MIARFYIPTAGQADAATRAAALNAVLAASIVIGDPRYAGRATAPCVVLDDGLSISVISDNPNTTLAAIDAVAATLADSEIPATIARDTEVAAGYATLTHNHDAAYSATAHTHAIDAAASVMRVANPQTMTATAQTAVTGMSFAAAANATYWFTMEIVIPTSTGTSPTTTWGFTGPASPTAVGIAAAIDTSTSVQVDALITSFTTFAAQAQVAATGAKFTGVIQTAGTAGTVQLTAGRGGTSPSMVVGAGSNGVALRVA